MSIQKELAETIKTYGIPVSVIARRTGLNGELLRRSLRCERRMSADEYVKVTNYLKSISKS